MPSKALYDLSLSFNRRKNSQSQYHKNTTAFQFRKILQKNRKWHTIDNLVQGPEWDSGLQLVNADHLARKLHVFRRKHY